MCTKIIIKLSLVLTCSVLLFFFFSKFVSKISFKTILKTILLFFGIHENETFLKIHSRARARAFHEKNLYDRCESGARVRDEQRLRRRNVVSTKIRR